MNNYKRSNYQSSYCWQIKKIKNKKNVQKNIKLGIVICFMILFFLMPLILFKPTIKLIGPRTITINMPNSYLEQGFKARNFFKDKTNKVKVNDCVDYQKAGFYKIKYSIKYLNSTISKYRYIIVKDTIKPVITFTGDNIIYIEVGSTYTELGYTATDNNDGNITSRIKVENNINIAKTGTYKVEYKVSDKAANSSSVSRTVVVTKKTDPNLKTIYLTFDDGPSSITPDILDVLKRENVKATFFMIGKDASYNDIIKRVHNEGHTVALHSATHKYGYIYQSYDNYFSDLYQIRDNLKNITGESANIIRFPGGSSNTVSRFNPGIMTYLTSEVIKRGFYYFDWNIDSGDTGRIGSDAIVNNVTSNLGSYHTNVVLMHDYGLNNQTALALERIIKYGKSKGYAFDRITSDTKAVHHGVNN